MVAADREVSPKVGERLTLLGGTQVDLWVPLWETEGMEESEEQRRKSQGQSYARLELSARARLQDYCL